MAFWIRELAPEVPSPVFGGESSIVGWSRSPDDPVLRWQLKMSGQIKHCRLKFKNSYAFVHIALTMSNKARYKNQNRPEIRHFVWVEMNSRMVLEGQTQTRLTIFTIRHASKRHGNEWNLFEEDLNQKKSFLYEN